MDSVTRALGRLGALHLRKSIEEEEELQPEDTEQEVSRCRELRARIEDLMQILELEPDPDLRPVGGEAASAEEEALSVEEVEKLAERLEGAVSPRMEQLEELEDAISDTEQVLSELEPFKKVRTRLSPLLESDLMQVHAGRVPAERVEEFREAMPPGVLTVRLSPAGAGPEDGAVDLLVVGARRRRYALETVLDEQPFQEREVPEWEEKSPADVFEEATEQREALREQWEAVRHEVEGLGEEYREDLQRAHAVLNTQLQVYEAEQTYGSTWATAVISGWVPRDRVEELRRTVQEVARGRIMVEVSEPSPEEIEEGRVPSYVPYPRFLAPFQRLVSGYGLAEYTEIEPTMMFAASFLLLFGVMFGDVGHGLCLLLIGALTRRWARKQSWVDIGHVIMCAGGASVLFGTFFQGSLFGKSLQELGFPLTLAFEPIRFGAEAATAGGHVMRYLLLAVLVGVGLISLGGLLNAVNNLRRARYEEGLLGCYGVAGLLFYWGSLGSGAKLAGFGPGPADPWMVGLFVALPLLVLILSKPLARLAGGRALWEGSPAVTLLEGLMEAMETVMVYLANTFSFLRVAGFALSHAALSYIIFLLVGIAGRLPAGIIWQALVFLLGTSVLIVLEGLIVSIQIMRLEYYEFFTKFFSGGGVRYSPFRLGAEQS
ncbi:MAG: V-type ATP synthase subunit I [Planctomycetota bacterium]